MMQGNETILLVEDERSIRMIAQTMLETLGYKVLPADGKDEALLQFEEHGDSIDLLFTDVVMPVMEGPELSKLILSIKPGLKCLFMSGCTEDDLANHGTLEKGAHFICKPFSMEKLSVKIREVLT